MELSGGQQLNLLLESIGIGVPLGLLFDVLTGLIPLGAKKRTRRFLMDMLFGLLAAAITFFSSLAIMDGRMHPVLFLGCFLGFVTEHLSFGRFVSHIVRRCSRWWRRCFGRFYSCLDNRANRLAAFLRRVLLKSVKNQQNGS